jgi:hypothetical protein
MKVGSDYTLTYLQSTLLERKPNKLRKVVSEQQHELITHVYTMNGIPRKYPLFTLPSLLLLLLLTTTFCYYKYVSLLYAMQ